MSLNRISSWSIRQPIPTLIFFLVITIAGLMSFTKLRINNFPDVTFPVVTVTVAQPGAAPAEIESQVARIVEDSVSGIGSVRHIYTTLGDGYANVSIEFQLGVDLDRATNDVRNAVASVRSDLPADIQDPVVQRMDSTGGAVLNYVVRGPGMTPEQLSWFVDNTVGKRLLSIKGVASVGRDGGVNREIRVQLDPARLAAQGVTASEISQQLRSFNINLPGGRVDLAGGEQAIRTLGSARSVDELRETRITLNNGRTIRLGDVADVTDGWTEPRGRARLNGEEVVGFNVNRTITSGEVGMATAVRAAVAELDKERADITIEEVTTSVDAVMESYIASIEALLLGAVLAVLVVFVFLRDWRATFVAAVAMPLSLIPTFFVMEIFNQSFNVVTLLALSLTVGILVDDAIVEIENIVRHIRDGKKPYPAAIEAADEIGLAVVATTATIIAVFAPVGFMPGVVGQFFVSFAIAACVSVFFSLVVARTITPLMGAYLLKADQGKEHGDPFWMSGYLSALAWGLKHKGLVLLFGVMFFAGSIF
ncbi:MAG: efflux RND transporter permease subunit, partial [Asticcacaulis sp.]